MVLGPCVLVRFLPLTLSLVHDDLYTGPQLMPNGAPDASDTGLSTDVGPEGGILYRAQPLLWGVMW